LDLLHRVSRLFPAGAGRTIGAALALISVLAFAGLSYAGDGTAETGAVTKARDSVQRISEEMKTTEPFPGSVRWVRPLEVVADRPEQETTASQFAWFGRRLPGFDRLDREAALAR